MEKVDVFINVSHLYNNIERVKTELETIDLDKY